MREKKGDFFGISMVESRQSESKSQSTYHGLLLSTNTLEFR